MAAMNPRPILGIGVNQLQAIRDALIWSISGQAIPKDLSPQVMVDWLVDQGLEKPEAETTDWHPVKIVSRVVDQFRTKSLEGLYMEMSCISSSMISPNAKPIGENRSGAGWSEGANFCISSAFVRVLGAWEQFEMDVLKALLYYRPSGKPLGHPTDQIEETVHLDIVSEKPEVKGNVDYYTKPAIWTWIRQPAGNKEERRKIFSRVYGFEMTHGDTDAERKSNNKLRKEWYNKRNDVAHGRAGVVISLKEFLDVDVFVSKAMKHLAILCYEEQLLVI